MKGNIKQKIFIFNTSRIIISWYHEICTAISNLNRIAVGSARLTLCSLSTNSWFRIECSVLPYYFLILSCDTQDCKELYKQKV